MLIVSAPTASPLMAQPVKCHNLAILFLCTTHYSFENTPQVVKQPLSLQKKKKKLQRLYPTQKILRAITVTFSDELMPKSDTDHKLMINAADLISSSSEITPAWTVAYIGTSF